MFYFCTIFVYPQVTEKCIIDLNQLWRYNQCSVLTL